MNRQRLDTLKRKRKTYTRKVLLTALFGTSDQKEMIRYRIKEFDKEISFVERNVLNTEFWDLVDAFKKKDCSTDSLVNTFLSEDRIDLLELGILVKSVK